MKKTMLLLFALMLSSAICAQDYHVVLWDNTTAPTSNGLSGDEVESKPGQWKNTQTAEMWIYKAGDNATGQALVFFPGGGYSSLSVGNGHKEAQWFARNGITAAVVKYRLPNGHSEVPRNDADEALRVMRSMAAELNIDPAKVGVSGTSAGGYLAGSVGTLSDVKPGFMILFYPVISADPDKRHKGTFVQLLGAEDADKPLAQEFSLEKKVDAATPPTLLFHCDDDKVVPAVNSALFYQKLKEQHRPTRKWNVSSPKSPKHNEKTEPPSPAPDRMLRRRAARVRPGPDTARRADRVDRRTASLFHL